MFKKKKEVTLGQSYRRTILTVLVLLSFTTRYCVGWMVAARLLC